MPTDLPYAADAEESLGYEELEVSPRAFGLACFSDQDGGVLLVVAWALIEALRCILRSFATSMRRRSTRIM
jgi:hypothetical protein